MFKLTCLIDDADLANTVRILSPLAHWLHVLPEEKTSPEPSGKTRTKGRGSSDNSSLHAVAAALRELDGPVTSAKVSEAVMKLGYSHRSNYHFLTKMIEAKLLTRRRREGSNAYDYDWPKS